MCAINPVHKKRIIFDFYTSEKIPWKKFKARVLDIALATELDINTNTRLRVHVKETGQEAD